MSWPISSGRAANAPRDVFAARAFYTMAYSAKYATRRCRTRFSSIGKYAFHGANAVGSTARLARCIRLSARDAASVAPPPPVFFATYTSPR